MGVIKFFKNMYGVFFGNNEELKEEVVVEVKVAEQKTEESNEEQEDLNEYLDKHKYCVLGEFAENDFFTNKVSELSKFTSIPLSTVYRLLKKAEKDDKGTIEHKGQIIVINTEYQDEIA